MMELLQDQTPTISNEVIALLGAGGGAIILKLLEIIFSKSNKIIDASLLESASMREDLREDVKNLKEEVRQAKADIDDWRNKYYILQEEISLLKGTLREKMEELVQKVGNIQNES